MIRVRINGTNIFFYNNFFINIIFISSHYHNIYPESFISDVRMYVFNNGTLFTLSDKCNDVNAGKYCFYFPSKDC